MHGIYIHIPFCTRKCFYCDFFSITDHSAMDRYVNALIEEISKSERKKASSVFIGGGTPTILKSDHLKIILHKIHEVFDISDNAEITIEANPGTLNREFLDQIKETGINRLSIGIQSFNDDELNFLQRTHDSKTAELSINEARRAGFDDDTSIDLIFSVPGQTMQSWEYSLKKAVDFNVEHISCYSLTYEEGTPLFNMFSSGKVSKQSEEIDADMFDHTMEYLNKNGFDHYEVSNYAKPGKVCLHNLNYWNGGTYSGFGSAAHSFDGVVRQWNIRSVDKYIEMIGNAGNAIAGKEILSEEDKLEEKIFLSVRCGYLSLREVVKNPSDTLLGEINMMESNGYLTFRDDIIRLTPKGFLMADDISLRIISLLIR